MINTNQIVPITATDLLTLLGTVMAIGQESLSAVPTALAPLDVEGDYKVTTNSAVALASAPLKSLDFDATASSVSAGTVYFVPAYDYAGFSIDGAAVITAGAEVKADGCTLYKAVLATGAVTISKVGF
jgi:hypothetical protein